MRQTIKSIVAAAALLGLSACATIPQGSSPTDDLVLNFAPEKQRFEEMRVGEVWLYLYGTIKNNGQTTVPVPNLRAILRDVEGQSVLETVIVPPRPNLEPGHTLIVQKTILRPPDSAAAVEVSWAPNK